MRAPNDEANYEYLKAREELMTNFLKVMADHKLDAMVHKAVEHQPTLIRDGINPPHVDQKGAPHINTFLVYVPSIVVPALAIVVLTAVAGFAQPKGPTVTIKGEAVDLWCYMEGGDRGPAKKECATACAKAGCLG